MNIKYKEYITGRDIQTLDKILNDGIVMGTDGKPQSFDTGVVLKRLNKAIELVVESVDDVKEGVLNKILDLPGPEYNEVLKKVKQIAGIDEDADQKKELSNTNIS